MYLEHFQLNKMPFSLTPSVEFFCNLPSHQAVLNVLLFGLNSGEGFIKIIGEVGSGKTLLCRKLLSSLDDQFVTAYIPNPTLNADGLRRAIARELHIEMPQNLSSEEVLQLINRELLKLCSEGKKVVLLIDEAQALSDESLEAVRLLTNLETESEKLLQIVMFAQPELDVRLNQHEFRQLNQRITFSHQLQSLSRDELDSYICHRLVTAGNTKGSVFNRPATDVLFKASNGIPRVVNILAHKSMLVAYGTGASVVTKESVERAIDDSSNLVTKETAKDNHLNAVLVTVGAVVLLAVLGVVYYRYLNYFLG
jgi:MSHA biogenesis protein MshM